jgi:succinate-semialdehyde dehydrogenase/glutarate-semialdehyde dehydrogenase
MSISTTDPRTGQVVKTFSALTEAEIDQRLGAASGAAMIMRVTSFAERAGWMSHAADALDAQTAAVAELMTLEMGKTLAAATAEAKKCAAAMRFYAERAEGFLAPEPADAATVGADRAYAFYQPLGPVLAVMPWNFPLWQVIRFAAPALMAGNAGLLKHASNVPQTALFLQDLFAGSGFPEGAFQTLLIGSDQVEAVIADPRVRAVTLTGSEGAGRAVASAAGRHLKKSVLELGGSDPFIVMPSADIARAAKIAATSRCQNNGQSCIAAKRFIVHRDVYDAFAAAFTDAMAALRIGDPMEDGTDIGPLALEQGRDTVRDQVLDAVVNGATILCGGVAPDRPGWWYPPTVVADLTPAARMWTEEVFGPVAGLFRADSYADAVRLANATRFGLGANAWTADPGEQESFVADLDAGAVFINGMVTSYPALPFGGIKDSGYGRELSAHGIREFCNVKTVWAA